MEYTKKIKLIKDLVRIGYKMIKYDGNNIEFRKNNITIKL